MCIWPPPPSAGPHRHFRSLVLMSSMGDEVLVHLAARAAPGIEVAFIDTGYHFPETLATAAAYAATQPLSLLTIRPLQSVAEQDAEYGARLHDRDPDRCCALRKVEPLERTLAGQGCLDHGHARVDAPTRSDIDVVTLDARRSMVKINPMATWTEAQTEAYARDHDVLLNPLRKSGYTSIGCAPCTRPTAPGDDPRAGRGRARARPSAGCTSEVGGSRGRTRRSGAPEAARKGHPPTGVTALDATKSQIGANLRCGTKENR